MYYSTELLKSRRLLEIETLCYADQISVKVANNKSRGLKIQNIWLKKKKTSPTHSKINRQINKQRQKMGNCVETQVTVIVWISRCSVHWNVGLGEG